MTYFNPENALKLVLPRIATAAQTQPEHDGTIPNGSRHYEIYKFIATLRDKGTPPQQAEPIAQAFNKARTAEPLHESEVKESVRCVYKYAKGVMPPIPKGKPKVINPKLMQAIAAADIPPVNFIVNDLLPQGLSILAGLPKIGKSFFSLLLCLSVAHGEDFLGYATKNGGAGVLYLALEDSDRRLQNRLKLVWGDKPVNDKFQTATEAPRGEALINQLDEYIKAHPDTVLIVIDTLQKVRRTTGQNGVYYSQDYDDMDDFKGFADKNNVCVLLVHHFRKMNDTGDVFNRVSGSAGLTGSADTMLALYKSNRFDDEATLAVTGRDIEETELTLYKDLSNNGFKWATRGTREEVEAERTRNEYAHSRVRQAVLQVLDGRDEWTGTMKQFTGANTWDIGLNKLSQLLKTYRPAIRLLDNIIYLPPSTPSVRLHQFKRVQPPA